VDKSEKKVLGHHSDFYMKNFISESWRKFLEIEIKYTDAFPHPTFT